LAAAAVTRSRASQGSTNNEANTIRGEPEHPERGIMSSDDGIITLGDAIIYLRMSDFRDADGMTFAERAEQLRTFVIGLGVPAGRIRVAIENDAGNGGGYRPASAYKRPVRVT